MPSDNWFGTLPFGPVDQCARVGGGDINQAYALQIHGEPYFLKVHQHKEGNFFRQEVSGLKQIGKAVRTPRVIHYGERDGYDYLLLEWIQPSRHRDDRRLGTDLAQLHRVTDTTFGFDEDNYAGQLPQYNHREKDWATFYIRWRLIPQVKIAEKRGHWHLYRQNRLERLADKITSTYQTLPVIPSLLHGDLWAGNVLFAGGGTPVFIDPAVFFGNREMDLAMTRLFGGFIPEFYQAYQDTYPLDSGWEERIPWYQLYYLLCHLNMFGEAYGSAVDRALDS